MKHRESDEWMEPIGDFMEQFHAELSQSLQSNSAVLTRAMEHLQHSSGKHVRPIMIGLCARMCGGTIGSDTLTAALVIELLHTASLIHDDVIDYSDTRRGRPTLNALYSNHQAVLMGDYVLSTAFWEIVSRCRNSDMLQTFAWVGRMLPEGELMQIQLSKHQTYRERDYIEMIDRKTGSLFQASGLLGALSVRASLEQQELCRQLGRVVGRVFQITDDLFDYDRRIDVGKPTGHDLIEGKVSLPLIYVLEHTSGEEHGAIVRLLQQPIGTSAIDTLIQIAQDKGGIAYTRRYADQLVQEGVRLLEAFDDTPARTAMLLLLQHITHRTS